MKLHQGNILLDKNLRDSFKKCKRYIDLYIFPIAITSNMFSMSALLIFLGVIGKTDLAADVGITQAATLAIFFAFSANARNLVLRDRTGLLVNQLLTFRFLMLPVLSCVSYLLSIGVVDVNRIIVVALIGRRCTEWLAELHLSTCEQINDYRVGYRFVAVQAASFLLIAIAIVLEYSGVVISTLTFWAVSPILVSFGFLLRRITKPFTRQIPGWRSMLPHLGSSWMIGLATYLFRLLIVLLTGKTIAGILFSAYAAGGMLNALYTYALGPSIALQISKGKKGSLYTNTAVVVSAIALSGLVVTIWAYTTSIQPVNHKTTSFFWIVFGISMIGAGVMILAQRTRLHLLQLYRRDDVVVPDILANILIIASVPFAYYIFGYAAMSFLFLWNAILNWFFYQLVAFEAFFAEGSKDTSSNFIMRRLNRSKIQFWVLLIIFMPLFFQLKGGIFNAADLIFDSQGSLQLVPLPVSVIACYLGLAFLLRIEFVKISVGFVFSFFCVMVFSTFVSVGTGYNIDLESKFILLIQFILPAFALVLGQSYRDPPVLHFKYEAIFLYVIAVIVPLELIATWGAKSYVLLPNIYIFSLYQHFQYIPVIFICFYFLAVVTLYEQPLFRKALYLIAPLMGVYAMASISMTAIFIAVFGSVLTMIILWVKGSKKFVIAIPLLVIIPLTIYGLVIKAYHDPLSVDKFQPTASSQIQTVKQNLPNFNRRLYHWKYYTKGIFESPKNFFCGHQKRPDRDIFTSAHNYYLDLAYNYGVISLIPFLFLITYTIITLKNRIRDGTASWDLIALALVVLFFIFIENSLQVGFKQPYPGIIMFFSWGVLLSKLTNWNGSS